MDRINWPALAKVPGPEVEQLGHYYRQLTAAAWTGVVTELRYPIEAGNGRWFGLSASDLLAHNS